MQLAVHIQRTFRRPDDPVGFVIDPVSDGAGFVVGDAPLHVKPFCGKFGMPLQHQTAALSAGITGFIIDPVGEIVFFQFIQNGLKRFQIFGVVRKTLGVAAGHAAARDAEGNIGHNAAVSEVTVRFQQEIGIVMQAMIDRTDGIFSRRILKKFRSQHKSFSFCISEKTFALSPKVAPCPGKIKCVNHFFPEIYKICLSGKLPEINKKEKMFRTYFVGRTGTLRSFHSPMEKVWT